MHRQPGSYAVWRFIPDMLITEAVPSPTFANHESFHLRYSWLKRAYNNVKEDRLIFTRDDALGKLGVGKNMVRSIRHWSLATKIIIPSGTKSNSPLKVSRMGDEIFRKGGLDPYMTRPETLWLLHWQMHAPPCRMPVWWMILNDFDGTEIKVDDMLNHIKSRVANIPGWKSPSEKSIKKDIDVFVRTYSTVWDRENIDDYADYTFKVIGLVIQDSKDRIRFVHGPKEGMTPHIVAYACLDYIQKAGIRAKSIAVSRLATDDGSVGRIFKLDEDDLTALLQKAVDSTKSMSLQNNNGSYQLAFKSAKEQADEMLAMAYRRSRLHMPRTREVVA